MALKRASWEFLTSCLQDRYYYSKPFAHVSAMPVLVAGTDRQLRLMWESTPNEVFNDINTRYIWRKQKVNGRRVRYKPLAAANKTLGDLGEFWTFWWLKSRLEPPKLRDFKNRNQLLTERMEEGNEKIDISFQHLLNGEWVYVHVCVKTSWEETRRDSSDGFMTEMAAAMAMPRRTIIIQMQLKNCACDNVFMKPDFYYRMRVTRNF